MKKAAIEPNSNWLIANMDAYLTAQTIHLSKSTLRNYGNDIRDFIIWLQSLKKVTTIGSIRADHVREYLADRKKLGSAQSSLHRYHMSLLHFDNWLLETKRRKHGFMYLVKPPRYVQEMKAVPSETEILAVIKSADEMESPIRNRAILELLYSCGLRNNELCRLSLSDYDGQHVHVKSSKAGTSRTVPITQEAQKWVDRYISEERPTSECEGLFLSNHGTPLSSSVLYWIVKECGLRAGFKNVTPHTFRHACATHLMNAGAHMKAIQDVLGHASIASTERYTKLSNAQRDSVFLAAHPRNNIKEFEV